MGILDRNAAPVTDISPEALAEHVAALRRYAFALSRNEQEAEDLVQDSLRRALAALDKGREIENLRAYLMTTLHNLRMDALRRKKRAGPHVELEEDMLPSCEPSQESGMIARQVLARIEEMGEDHRQVLLMVGLEGMSYREISETLGVPEGTVMSRLSRARAELRRSLAWDA